MKSELKKEIQSRTYMSIVKLQILIKLKLRMLNKRVRTNMIGCNNFLLPRRMKIWLSKILKSNSQKCFKEESVQTKLLLNSYLKHKLTNQEDKDLQAKYSIEV